jgi:hypothetical protein
MAKDFSKALETQERIIASERAWGMDPLAPSCVNAAGRLAVNSSEVPVLMDEAREAVTFRTGQLFMTEDVPPDSRWVATDERTGRPIVSNGRISQGLEHTRIAPDKPSEIFPSYDQ